MFYSLTTDTNQISVQQSYRFNRRPRLPRTQKMPGYEVPKFKDDVDSARYVCARCELLLKEPIKLRCEHRLCRSCAEDILAQNTPAQCPRDDCKVTFLQKDKHGAPVSFNACCPTVYSAHAKLSDIQLVSLVPRLPVVVRVCL